MVKPTPLRAAEPGDMSPCLLRTPPHNIEVERALLGAILLNNRSYEKVQEYLLPDHFTEAVNGRIYAAIRKLIDRGDQANAVTLKTYLERDDLVIAAGGMKYLAALSTGMVTVVNAGSYGRMIFDLHARRELICIGENIVNAAYDAQIDESAADILGVAEGGLGDLGRELAALDKKDNITLASAVERVLEEHARIDRGEISGISSGIQIFDTQVGLLQPGDLVVIAGRPGQGKSALASTITYHAAQNFRTEIGLDKRPPKQILIFSGEMTAEQWAARLLTAHTSVPQPRQRTVTLSESDWAKLIEVQSDFSNLPIRLLAKPAPTISQMMAECRQAERQGGVGLIVVDYIQIMGLERDRRLLDRRQQVDWLVRALKGLAGMFKCPVIGLSQINRGVEQRENKRPGMADLRESGEIEAAADTIIMVHREAHYLENNRPAKSADLMEWNSKLNAVKDQAEAIVVKARHGTTGTAFLKFDGPKTWFSDPAFRAVHQPELGL